jgi:hypothetical protein
MYKCINTYVCTHMQAYVYMCTYVHWSRHFRLPLEKSGEKRKFKESFTTTTISFKSLPILYVNDFLLLTFLTLRNVQARRIFLSGRVVRK